MSLWSIVDPLKRPVNYSNTVRCNSGPLNLDLKLRLRLNVATG